MRNFYSSAAAALLISIPLASSAQVSQREDAAIYGSDDRQDYYQVTNTAQRDVGVRSAAVVMSAYAIDTTNPNDVKFRANTLGRAANLCSGEAFSEQEIPGFCSAVLIADDLILTAGHCVWDEVGQCPNLRFVFDMYLTSGSQTEPRNVSIDDIYGCKQVIIREQSSGSDGNKDWAVVQLDRKVDSQRTPATLRTARTAVRQGDALLMIGGPNGLPLKWDAGGIVRDPRASVLDTFKSTVDAFGGNSGSGVWLRDSLELAGILVSGDQDYVQSGTCNRVNNCGADGCAGENIIYLHRVLDNLCATIKHPICGTSPTCGDSYCAASESETSCPADCEPVVCGDGYCSMDEWEACPSDCVKEVPNGWTCREWEYGTFDGCDTTCGAKDPDCDIKSAGGSLSDLFSCQSGTPGSYAAMMLALSAILGGFAIRGRRRSGRA